MKTEWKVPEISLLLDRLQTCDEASEDQQDRDSAAAAKEIHRMRGEYVRVADALEQALTDRNAIAIIRDKKATKARRRIEQLEAGLTDFGRHRRACDVHSLTDPRKCNCGYGALFAGDCAPAVGWSKESPSGQGWFWYRASSKYHPTPTFIEDCGGGKFMAVEVYEQKMGWVEDANVEWWPLPLTVPASDK